MKRILLLIVSILFISVSFSQDISGTWGGLISIKPSRFNRLTKTYYFFLEIKQKGRTIWGVYNTSDSSNNKNITCLCSISGSLPKKPGATFDLYKENIEDYDKKNVGYEFCNLVSGLSLHYFLENTTEYLAGQWFHTSDVTLARGTSGSFVLQHINSLTSRSVDDYFPKLDKMIEKGAVAGQMPLTKADDISTATPTEQRLINAMKKLIGKK